METVHGFLDMVRLREEATLPAWTSCPGCEVDPALIVRVGDGPIEAMRRPVVAEKDIQAGSRANQVALPI